MGAVYLCYSAFYVSLSIPAMYFFLNVSSKIRLNMLIVCADLDLHHALHDGS